MIVDASQAIHELATKLSSVRQEIDIARVIQDAIDIQQIPAPTFAEDIRAAFIREKFTHYPLRDISTDSVYNVYGRWPGSDPNHPAVMVSAHLDTVFPVETDLTIRREQDRIYGPGLGDNSLGVAGLLAVLDTLQKYHIQPKSDIWFVANSREEGLGDLGGIRAVWSAIGPNLGSAIVLEGMALGRVYNAGIAVRRLHITCHAPGGHSWLHFGQPSAIHGLIDLGSRITAIHPPTEPRTTYNIGLIEGGHSVNSLATSASLYLDLRSEERSSLAALEQKVMRAVETTQKSDLTFSTEVVGDRPAGQIPTGHPLVQLAAATLRHVGLNALYETGSTDANVLLANGLPTVTIGISYGGHAHREDEFIETGPIPKGIWQTILLTLGAADYLSF